MHHRATCNRVPHSHKSFPSQLVDTFPIEIKFRFNLIRERGGPSPSLSSQKQKGWTRRGSPFFFSFPPPREFFPRVPSPPRILDSSRPFPPPFWFLNQTEITRGELSPRHARPEVSTPSTVGKKFESECAKSNHVRGAQRGRERGRERESCVST